MRVDPSGLAPGDLVRVERVLAEAGYTTTTNATGKARVVFAVGEPRKSETVVEVPKYEQRHELRFINGQQRVFIDQQFVGYERVYVESTVYPSSVKLEVSQGDESRVVRQVSTEGECGDRSVLKPALLNVLLSAEARRQQEIILEGC